VHAGALLHEGTGRLYACGGGNAHLHGSHRLERPGGVRPGEARRYGADPWDEQCIAVRAAIRESCGRPSNRYVASEEKLEKLKHLGADTVIHYKAVPDWGQKAKDLTDGRGVDHVIEVGGPGTLTQSITACRTGGHIALIGVLTGFAGEVSIPALFSNQIRISGISIGSRADQQDMIRAITANRLNPVIDQRFLLQEIVPAFKYYESQKHSSKVCLEL
jgi:hypothetical protein